MQKQTPSSTVQPERQPENLTSEPERGPGTNQSRRKPMPPDSIPNLLPGVDPQQTPGIDHLPAEWDQ